MNVLESIEAQIAGVKTAPSRQNVGTVRLTFMNRNNASFAWTVNGASNVKSLTRFTF